MALNLEEQKAWCTRNFCELKDILFGDGDNKQNTLRHLQSDTFEGIVLAVSQAYEEHVRKSLQDCIGQDDLTRAWSILTAQHEIYTQFEDKSFVPMTRKLGRHILQMTCPTSASPILEIVPPSPSPCSGPPTPCTTKDNVNNWLEHVEIESERILASDLRKSQTRASDCLRTRELRSRHPLPPEPRLREPRKSRKKQNLQPKKSTHRVQKMRGLELSRQGAVTRSMVRGKQAFG